MKKFIIIFLSIIAILSLNWCWNNKEEQKREETRKLNLNKVYNILYQYKANNNKYPTTLEDKVLQEYIVSKDIFKDPKTWKEYFYHSLYKNWYKNAWFIIWAQMENPKNCNSSIYSEKELKKLLKENNYISEKIQKYINKKNNLTWWCYYIVIKK